MPTYDYQCCGKKFERITSIAQRDNVICPLCNGLAKRLLSAPQIMLDGTDPGFPDAYDRWAKRHENHGK